MNPESWDAVRAITPARVALGRAGGSLTTAARLRFRADHARASDAVNEDFDVARLVDVLTGAGHAAVGVSSGAGSREEYVRRPDLGRVLAEDSRDELRALGASTCDVAIVLCDGLSPLAVERHGPALVDAIVERLGDWAIAPVTVVANGRVAVGDDVGFNLGARLVVVLIGERPGLSVPESVGAYLTFRPALGRTDAQRNCVSNIHERGLSVEAAANRIAGLCRRASILGLSGIGLHDEEPTHVLDSASSIEPTS